jgi:hypothetical protein
MTSAKQLEKPRSSKRRVEPFRPIIPPFGHDLGTNASHLYRGKAGIRLSRIMR